VSNKTRSSLTYIFIRQFSSSCNQLNAVGVKIYRIHCNNAK